MASNDTNHQEDEESWAKKIISLCCTSAIAIAVYTWQSKSNLPYPFYLIPVALLVAFFVSLISKLLNSSSSIASNVFELIGILAAILSFFMSMAFSVPPSIRLVAWLICSLSVILTVAHHIDPDIIIRLNCSTPLLDWFYQIIRNTLQSLKDIAINSWPLGRPISTGASHAHDVSNECEMDPEMG